MIIKAICTLLPFACVQEYLFNPELWSLLISFLYFCLPQKNKKNKGFNI